MATVFAGVLAERHGDWLRAFCEAHTEYMTIVVRYVAKSGDEGEWTHTQWSEQVPTPRRPVFKLGDVVWDEAFTRRLIGCEVYNMHGDLLYSSDLSGVVDGCVVLTGVGGEVRYESGS